MTLIIHLPGRSLKRGIKLLIITISICLSSCNTQKLNDRLIRFDQAAVFFEQAFPMGNGRIGLTVYGDPINEKIAINEATLWAGGPVDANMNPDAYKHLPDIRKALFSEDYKKADGLVRNLQGKFSESFAPLGNMEIHFDHESPANNYSRELDIRRALTKISYSIGDNQYGREIFVSHPDQVAVIHCTSKEKGLLNFSLKLNSQLHFTSHITDNQVIMDGFAPIHAEPNYRGNIPNTIIYGENGKGMRFRVIADLDISDGELLIEGNSIIIQNASTALIRLSVATSYNGFDRDPGLDGKNEKKLALKLLDSSVEKDYSTLKSDHIKEFSSFFNRVSLSVNNAIAPGMPIDERLKQYSEGTEDSDLECLYFQFGRYLLISSSRPGGIPANLQGIWNPHLRPPWSSNFTANINSQMNYWPAEVTNLSEMHEPLLSFIQRLAETGEITAQTFYDCSGWCCSHNTDIWAMTNPVGDFGNGHPVWANWSMAGAWYSLHLYDHFSFTNDTAWLKTYAYPLMKGASDFLIDFLTESPDGYLVTAPSTSPENLYKTSEGYVGATLYGGTSDLAFIRGLFEKIIEVSQILDLDQEYRELIMETLERIYPYQIGSKGHLQEWYYDWEDQNPYHRHLSHLVGLYPDNQFSPIYTPALAAACKRSLEIRGDGGTGWSKAWKINLHARLLDGDHAYTMLRSHLNYVDPSGETKYGGGGTYPNLWDAHPPFQIDGNFGGTSGIAEMLLQSHMGEIHLLPALPSKWENGTINGLRARGAVTVNQIWNKGELSEASIIPDHTGTYQIRYKNQVITRTAKAGKKIRLKAKDFQ
ncbi:MAG: glycoside hydrolase family 95 protein [Bacteroidetes bacterium]|jgi:alpha-L-fucosidase 2|nr:glycoside hydrolase family 95 protein [Bacteroidota bacterium]MBT4399121.1 glycoside hydrolase family 95 protein [Bacteroidota bacterium]MBT5425337.1 glycoside hydrolase family 95 protein [Bacteroidota bacterium]MBT7093437.1 glycoside hydrolase family 95 protein [Bacteroidota bacterium]MBT7466525.1 glycoside hydrolase family 95 protein [Bacteroidota bacterium]